MNVKAHAGHRNDVDLGKNKFVILVCDWIADYHVPTLEQVLVSLITVLGLAVLFLSAHIIVVPPPYMVGFALILPAPLWAFLLLSSAFMSVWGRVNDNTLARYRGAVLGFITCAALCGPLYLKAPWMTTMLVGLLLLQSVLVRRLEQAFSDEIRVHRKGRSSDLP